MPIFTSRTRALARRAPAPPWDLDWHSPHVRGLQFYYVYHWGRPYDLVTRTFAGVTANAKPRTPTEHGLMSALVSARYLTGRLPLTVAGGITMLSVGNKGTSGRVSALCQRSSNGVDQVEIRANAQGTDGAQVNGTIAFLAYDGGTSGYAHGAMSSARGKYYWTVGRLIGNTTPSIWMDGVDITSASLSASMSGLSGELALGGLPDSTAIPYDAHKLLDAGWNVALTDDAIREITWERRWGLLRSLKSRYFLPAAAAGGGATHTITPSGGIAFAGDGTYKYTRVHDVSGGPVFGGSADLVRTQIMPPSGGIQFGGSADLSSGVTITPSGGITFSGSATAKYTRVHGVSGGVQFAGGGAFKYGTEIVPDGGLTFSGDGNFTGISSVFTITPSGGVVFGGSASGTLFDSSGYAGFAHRVVRKIADDVADDVTDFHRRYDD